MRPRVTVIVVAQNAADALVRTLPAIERQTRAPERRVLVALNSRDTTPAIMRATEPDVFVELPASTSFGEAVRAAVAKLEQLDSAATVRREEFGADDEAPNDWLWLLNADNTPDPDALEELLDTAERNPSLEITGPKIVRADDPAVLYEYGESVTASGVAVKLHHDALDQGQFEHLSDVLGVAVGGMLVRRDTWDRLGGFDPGLDAVDEGLDLCVRTWLSGGRVLLSPRARVETLAEQAPGTLRYGKRTRGLTRYRIHRQAQLHRNLVWADRFEFVFAWLALVPVALLRAVGHLLRKNPGRILPDLRAALAVVFGRTGIGQARRNFRRTATQPSRVLDRLLLSSSQWRKLRAIERDEYRAVTQQGTDRYNFITGGGGWVTLLAIALAVVLWFPLLNATALTGGQLLPLGDSIGQLWGATGYGLRDTGGGIGVADPFNLVLAVLGTITFWNPSQIIVVLWVLAMPIAAVGGWFLAARFTLRPWLRAFFALLWLAAAPLQLALAQGQLTGVLVHLTLPWLLFTVVGAARSWAAAAVCSLLMLVTAACSPSLLPALAVLWLLAVVLSGRGWVRHIFTIVPTVVMFLPLAVTQFNRGRPLAVFADPGLPLASDPARGWHTVALFSQQPPQIWRDLLAGFGSHWDTWLVLVALLIPLGFLAVLGLFGSGWRVAWVALTVATLGFVTAGVAGGVAVATTGGQAVPLLIGPAQSLGLIGLAVAALAGATLLGSARIPVTVVALLGVFVLAAPIAPAQLVGNSAVAASDGRTLPAIVAAQGRVAPQLGTLIITPNAADALQVSLVRGSGQKLNTFSTLETTNLTATDSDAVLAEIAVGFLSAGESNPIEQLHELGIGFIVVQPAPTGGGVLEQRLITAMSTNEALSAAGETSEYGSVFEVVNAAETPTDQELAGALATNNWQDHLGRGMLLVQLAVLAFVVLLALPTGGLESRVRVSRELGKHRWEHLECGRDFGARGASHERVDVYSDNPTGDHIDGEDDRA